MALLVAKNLDSLKWPGGLSSKITTEMVFDITMIVTIEFIITALIF